MNDAAYNMGYEDYWAGEGLDDNPYYEVEDQQEWEEGWIDAENKDVME